MPAREPGTSEKPKRIMPGSAPLLFLGAALILPALSPGFTWVLFLVPLPLFLVLAEQGKQWRGIGAITLTALVIAAFTGEIISVCFGLAMMPAGVAMITGLERNSSPAWSATRTFTVMAASWLLLGGAISLVTGRDVYSLLLTNIQEGINASLEMIKGSKELSPGQVQEIKATAAAIKEMMPQVLPGIIIASLTGSTMLNLVLGQWLLRKRRPELVVWPPFSHWKVPEPLVFAVIIAGFGLLLPLPGILPVAIGALLFLYVIYFYQGLAILTHLFEYWRTPVGLRAIVYGLMVLQAYGIIFLSLTGIIDVWADFRGRLERMADRNKKSSERKDDPEE